MSENRGVIVDSAEPGRLLLGALPVPASLPSEASIRVRAISLNRGEVRMSRSPRPGWRPGWDFAGEVEQAAADGTGPAAGARVVGMLRSGAWAERIAAPTNQLAELPESVTFAQGAALPVAGLTAMHALMKGGFLLEKRVFVTGATGGVGDFALQLARLAGAIPVAHVRRSEQEAQVREAGAEHVVIGDRLTGAERFGPYSLALDSVGGEVLTDLLALVEEGSKVVLFGTSGGGEVTFNASKFYGTGMTTLYGFFLFDELRTVEAASVGLKRLAGLVAQGRLTPRISLEADWTDVDRIARELMDRTYPGKAVLTVHS